MVASAFGLGGAFGLGDATVASAFGLGGAFGLSDATVAFGLGDATVASAFGRCMRAKRAPLSSDVHAHFQITFYD